ncbi:type I secretion system permease/ATPase [Variibacter gotjawalensis]|uniref:type I secretion system permease/ATPase n=1 Tax=Variibacter gotjawalensis TaxID=1333996 RepID=UPI0012FE2F33|nr:type I secretion system permease/ATPase [Variibacter gotjawalensis]NIK46579.1 PrtD family type I secretion system ABC transporter [Variibacter gotjawalensis]
MRSLLRPLMRPLGVVAAASAAINILMLTGPWFMLQVYDRVLSSRSGATLLGLCLFALVLFLFQGLFDGLRGRMLISFGRLLADRLAPRSFDIVTQAPGQEGVQAVRDTDTLRSFVGNGLPAYFDLPWTPVYAALCFAFHPALGAAVLAGGILIALLAWLADRTTRRPVREGVERAVKRNQFMEATRRNGLVAKALGMHGSLRRLWQVKSDDQFDRQDTGYTVTGDLGALTRLLRTILQSGVLALGAWLVLQREASGGIMLAATILTIRALAPVEQAMSQWRNFVAARQAWQRLNESLEAYPEPASPTPLPLPSRELSVAGVSIAAPGSERPLVANVTFSLKAGSALGIIGPSGSGKSSLARALVGAWPTARGVIRLDGGTFDQWSRDALGSAVGYLPQDVELLTGTVAQNIARFNEDASSVALQKAAAEADVHELILRLPQGYDTEVGDSGLSLSGGQRQRIGLARALFGKPFLVVLDEPNSNLDAAGEQALTRAIVNLRMRGSIVIVIAHRSSALAAVDHLMVLNEGHVQAFGPRDKVLASLGAQPMPQPAAAAAPSAQAEANPKPQKAQRQRSRVTKEAADG